MLRAMEATMGVISVACEQVGISRFVYYKWLREDEEFARSIESIAERQKDFVEAQLLKRIKEGSDAAIIFYAKTKMKERGYQERVEVDGNNKHDVTIRVIRDAGSNPAIEDAP